MKFTERINEKLKETEYTQKEIAEKLCIDPANITNWKTGKNVPSIETLFELCILLQTSADYLLGLRDEDEEIECNNYIDQRNSQNINIIGGKNK